MKKLPLLQLIALFLSSTAFGQESVGFSEPGNIRPLLDYRLPAWGYNNFLWNFSLNGNFRSTDRDDQNNSLSRQLFSGRLMPTYTRFFESEPRVFTLLLRPEIDMSLHNQNSFSDHEFNNSVVHAGINWDLRFSSGLRYYMIRGLL